MTMVGDLQLFTPGPVNVPPRVLAAGARPMLHHRSAEFSRILSSMIEKAQRLFGTQQDVLLVHGSGRAAMEGTITNLFAPGDEILSICNGNFGEMYARIAEYHKLNVRRICADWLKPLDLAEVAAALKEYPAAKAITVPQCETSTAVVNDIPAIASMAREHGKLLLVDSVSSAGCMPMEIDAWGVDAMVTASQKGLMSPTGLSLTVLSDRAWKATETARLSGYYVQYREIRRTLHGARTETPGSTPVSLVCSVEEALRMIEEEGQANVYARHARVAKAVRAGVEAMGLSLFQPDCATRSASVTAFSVPPATDGPTLRAVLKDELGLVVAGGLGSAHKERVIRIGHMGYCFPKDALTVIGALEAALFKLGCLPALGRGTAACIRALA
jgi:aspartate aminotransferase-like enzyme